MNGNSNHPVLILFFLSRLTYEGRLKGFSKKSNKNQNLFEDEKAAGYRNMKTPVT